VQIWFFVTPDIFLSFARHSFRMRAMDMRHASFLLLACLIASFLMVHRAAAVWRQLFEFWEVAPRSFEICSLFSFLPLSANVCQLPVNRLTRPRLFSFFFLILLLFCSWNLFQLGKERRKKRPEGFHEKRGLPSPSETNHLEKQKGLALAFCHIDYMYHPSSVLGCVT